MEFRILGPLQVIDDAGRSIEFGPRQARVLATMLMAANTAVSVSELISAAWDDPPATARRQIQNCVWLLRKQVSVKADGRGYLLRVPDGALDAQRFQDLTTLAGKDAAEGRHEDAVRRLTDALRCGVVRRCRIVRARPCAPEPPASTSSGWPPTNSASIWSWRWASSTP